MAKINLIHWGIHWCFQIWNWFVQNNINWNWKWKWKVCIWKKMSFLLKLSMKVQCFPRESLIGGSFKSLECISLEIFIYSSIIIKETRVKLMKCHTHKYVGKCLPFKENEFSTKIIDESWIFSRRITHWKVLKVLRQYFLWKFHVSIDKYWRNHSKIDEMSSRLQISKNLKENEFSTKIID